jgi:hypothetical protein
MADGATRLSVDRIWSFDRLSTAERAPATGRRAPDTEDQLRTVIQPTDRRRLVEFGCDLVGIRMIDRFVGTLTPAPQPGGWRDYAVSSAT